MNKISRRDFAKKSAAAAFGFMILPRWVIGKETPPSERLNVAVIGVGGRGEACCNEFSNFERSRCVAFCDVDDGRAAGIYNKYPDVARFKDYRVMLDKMGRDIDAVAVATPDHAHYAAAAWAMACGKHVYVEKPLARTVWEVRQLKRMAQKAKVVTQMGNQGHTTDGWRKVREWYLAGLLGDIVEIHQWTDRPIWPQGELQQANPKPAPGNLDFNLWLNVAPDQPYRSGILPFSWRGLRDFGTSALGDMGCHFMDVAVSAFNLGRPVTVQGNPTPSNEWSWPQRCNTVYEFKNPDTKGLITLYWYEGDSKPQGIEGVSQEDIDSQKNATIIVGTKRKVMLQDPYGHITFIYPREEMRQMHEAGELPAPSIPRVPDGPHREWARGCLEGFQPGSNIAGFSADFTETVLLGLLPIFRPGLKLEYDYAAMSFKNDKSADKYLSSLYPLKQEFLPQGF